MYFQDYLFTTQAITREQFPAQEISEGHHLVGRWRDAQKRVSYMKR